MKQKIVTLCIASLMAIAQGYGGVMLNVPDVNIAQGGTSNVVIYFDLGEQAYTAYQMDIAYPEGIKSVNDDEGNPAFDKGDVYSGAHNVSSIHTTTGLDRFQCFSTNSVALTAQSGILLILPITAQKSMAEGTYQATISPIEFVQTDATPDRPAPITFNITVTKSVVLDEMSTTAPSAATNVDVIVRRTFNADEWSTICLPFEMTEAQVKASFGNDVRLGDFKGYVTEENQDGGVVGITVNFTDAVTIEANHPYIIKVSSDINEFTVEGVDIVLDKEPIVAAVPRTRRQWSEMIGTYVANTVLESNTVFICENQFWYSAGQTKMKAYRAYFDFYDVLEEVDSQSASSNIKMSFDNTDVIGSYTITNPDAGNSFDLQGRRIQKPVKGIYIREGKKVVKK